MGRLGVVIVAPESRDRAEIRGMSGVRDWGGRFTHPQAKVRDLAAEEIDVAGRVAEMRVAGK